VAVKEILLIGNPDLRKLSEDVTEYNDDLINIVTDLKDTLIDFQSRKLIGRGIAAPQIGIFKKVIYIKVLEKSFALINPEITWKSKETYDVWDSCFSFDVAFFVKTRRFKSIKVKYQTEEGFVKEEEFKNDLSELLQHEIDHLHGILATDRLLGNKEIILREEWERRYK